ncbi:MAG: SCO family protein [Deltaproteobacteria bacterium]|nr:SCO family protein [Deltaproteobacteria bacterium]
MAGSCHSRQRRALRWAALALVASTLVGAGADSARADGERARKPSPTDEILAPRPTYEANGVTVNEQLGARVPLDARFRTQDGAVTTLGELLQGELPTILTFNYSDCPMLCSLQLNGLTAALPAVAAPGPAPAGADQPGDMVFRIGAQFRIITIGLEPTETPERLAKTRERYLAKLGPMSDAQRASVRAGWTFLVAEKLGDAAAIRRVADSVGFAYVYIKDRAEWAHPAALILLSTTGVVTRYVYGIEFEPQVLRESIFKAGLAEPQSAVGFMNRCYHFDPAAKDHSRAGVMALRVAAAGFVVLFAGGFGFFLLRRRRAPRSGRPELS